MVLSGGGARAAYQAGFLCGLARRVPDLQLPILTGVSAGAINAAFLAAHPGPFGVAASELAGAWRGLELERVFRVDAGWLVRNFVRWGFRLLTGGATVGPQVRGLLDTAPLRELLCELLCAPDGTLHGVRSNLASGRLQALALITVEYAARRTVTWVDGASIETWERPNRVSRHGELTVDHVLASAALPLIFPAVRLGEDWYGDGGIRLAAPLAPAVHLGARRILALSTAHGAPANDDELADYPSPALIAGNLLNAIFIDALDHDALQLQRINALVNRLPPGERDGLRHIELSLVRPSLDLGRLSADYEPRLPRAFRFLTRGLGTRETNSPDFLSLLMFQSDYLTRLVEVGESDAEAAWPDLEALVGRGA